MLWLYIVLGILLFILILLLFSATLDVTASNDELYVDVKYIFLRFRVYPQKEKKPKKEKKKEKDQTSSSNNETVTNEEIETKNDEVSNEPKTESKVSKKSKKKKEEANKKKEKKTNPLTQIGDILDMLDGVGKYILKLVRSIRITIELDMKVGGKDAAEAAINYGKYSAAIWALIGHADALMTVNPKRVNIGCDFEFNRLTFFLHSKIKLRLITALVIALCLAFRVLKNYIKKER